MSDTLSGLQPASLQPIAPVLALPQTFVEQLGSVISELEVGCVTMVESNQLKPIHHSLHHLMVSAVASDWQVTLVDLANCFNPQLISTIAFEYGLMGQHALSGVSLARPFQIHQATSIISGLVEHLRRKKQSDPRPHLVVLTDISGLFFDIGIKNEDPEFPVPQLEMMRQSVGILQSLAVQGNTVLITDKSERVKSIINLEDPPQIRPASLRYSAKVHVRVEETEERKVVQLVTHPFQPARKLTIRKSDEPNRSSRKKGLTLSRQQSLEAYF